MVMLVPQGTRGRSSSTWSFYSRQFSSVQSLSRVQLFVTPWTAAHQASLFITNTQSLRKLISIESVMPSSHFILCHPLLLLPSIFPSIRVFSNGTALCIRWPKYWSFSLSISSSSEYSELISFRIDWFDLLGVQGSGCNVKLVDQERPTEKVIDKQRAGGAQKSLWNSRREVFL